MALNLWTVSEERVIPEAVWAQVCWEDTELDPRTGPRARPRFEPGAGGRLDRRRRRRRPYRLALSIGTRAMSCGFVHRAAELVKKYKAELVLDGKGPARLSARRSRGEGRPGPARALAYGQSEMTTACATFYDAVADRRVGAPADEALDNAVAAARRRQVGDSWTWGRRDTSRDASPLIAATLVFHRATNPPPKPRVIDMRDYTVFTRDDLLTHATIYWTGNAIASSIRTYANNNRYPWAPSHDRTPVIEAPTGMHVDRLREPPGVNSPEERIESFLASDRAAWYNHVNIAATPTAATSSPGRSPNSGPPTWSRPSSRSSPRHHVKHHPLQRTAAPRR